MNNDGNWLQKENSDYWRHAIANFVSMLKEKNQLDGVALEIYIKIYDKIMCNIFCNQNVRVEQ